MEGNLLEETGGNSWEEKSPGFYQLLLFPFSALVKEAFAAHSIITSLEVSGAPDSLWDSLALQISSCTAG